MQDRKLISCDSVKCLNAEKWFHAICVQITKKKWKEIEANPTMKWYCPSCVNEMSNKQDEIQLAAETLGRVLCGDAGSEINEESLVINIENSESEARVTEN